MVTGAQIVAARDLLQWAQTDLAKKAKLRPSVIMRAEASPGEPVITISQMDALLRALRAGGIEFTSEEPGVRLARKAE
jgi:ribosome-binding protein aMBF1 (putative translation factor)